MNELGIYIRELRKRKALTLQNLADMTGLTIATVHYIETGKVVPTFGSIKKIANKLEVPVEELTKRMD